jgi:hypothetical protein
MSCITYNPTRYGSGSYATSDRVYIQNFVHRPRGKEYRKTDTSKEMYRNVISYEVME